MCQACLSAQQLLIALSWSAPLFEDCNGVIRHYIVNVTELETGYEFGEVTTHMARTYSSLHPYYTYEFSVYAVTVVQDQQLNLFGLPQWKIVGIDIRWTISQNLLHKVTSRSHSLSLVVPSGTPRNLAAAVSYLIITCSPHMAAPDFRTTKWDHSSICCEFYCIRIWRRI